MKALLFTLILAAAVGGTAFNASAGVVESAMAKRAAALAEV